MRSLSLQRGYSTANMLRVIPVLFVFLYTQVGKSDSGVSFSHTEEPGKLHISEKHQELGGIVTGTFQPSDYLPEISAFGKVLSLDPLLEIEHQMQQAESERKVSAATRAAAQTAYRQVQDLYNDQAVSRVKLAQSKADWISAGARLDQAVSKLRAIRLKALQNWGKVLTDWTSNPGRTELDLFICGEAALLSISLRTGEHLSDGTQTVFVNRGAIRSEARPAKLISFAPHAGAKSQGESYFFQTPANSLRTGMQIYVWIPVPGKARRGIEIPAEALVWRDGKPWAYRKTGPESFHRVPVENAPDHGERWFLAEATDDSAEIVVSGGQMLLSQEFHWQIPDEDDE